MKYIGNLKIQDDGLQPFWIFFNLIYIDYMIRNKILMKTNLEFFYLQYKVKLFGHKILRKMKLIWLF